MSENGKPQHSLHKKLAEIMATVGRIEKRGHNAYHGYAYATESDVAEALRHEMASRHLTMIASVEKIDVQSVGREGKSDKYITTVYLDYTITDGETGECLSFKWAGCGEDSSEKGIYKAYTGAQKYALMKTFMIPTGDDPERDERKEKRSDSAGRAGVAAGGAAGPLPACPECGKTESVIAGKAEYGGGFVCFKKKGGCGAKWKPASEKPLGADLPPAAPDVPGGPGHPDYSRSRFAAIAKANAYGKVEKFLDLVNRVRARIGLSEIPTFQATKSISVANWDWMLEELEKQAGFMSQFNSSVSGVEGAQLSGAGAPAPATEEPLDEGRAA